MADPSDEQHGQCPADQDADLLARELEIDEQRVLYVADNASLADEAGATTWDCGLVLAHYLIKQHEMGEVRHMLYVHAAGSPSSDHRVGCYEA
jgi:hypothetical protein